MKAGINVTHALKFFLFLFTSSLVFATPMGFANLHHLMNESSVIAVAEIISGVENGESFPVTLRIIRNIAGTHAGEIIVADYNAPRVFPTTGSSVKGVKGLWFLKKDDANRYQILPVMIGAAPIGMAPLTVLPELPEKWMYTAETIPVEKLLYELIAEMESAKQPGYLVPLGIVNLISSDDGSLSPRIFRRSLTSSVPDISHIGILGLVHLNEVSGLGLFRERLSEVMRSSRSSDFEKILCRYQNQDIDGIQLLASFIRNPESSGGIRYCAAHALRMISSHEAFSALMREIDHKDLLIRYEAISAVITHANSSSGNTSPKFREISFHEFRENESEIVSFWKNWLKDHLQN